MTQSLTVTTATGSILDAYQSTIATAAILTVGAIAPTIFRTVCSLPSDLVKTAGIATGAVMYVSANTIWDYFRPEQAGTCFKVIRGVSCCFTAITCAALVLNNLGARVGLNSESAGLVACWVALEILGAFTKKV